MRLGATPMRHHISWRPPAPKTGIAPKRLLKRRPVNWPTSGTRLPPRPNEGSGMVREQQSPGHGSEQSQHKRCELTIPATPAGDQDGLAAVTPRHGTRSKCETATGLCPGHPGSARQVESEYNLDHYPGDPAFPRWLWTLRVQVLRTWSPRCSRGGTVHSCRTVVLWRSAYVPNRNSQEQFCLRGFV